MRTRYLVIVCAFLILLASIFCARGGRDQVKDSTVVIGYYGLSNQNRIDPVWSMEYLWIEEED